MPSDPFPTTRWSLLLDLGNAGPDGGQAAFAHLYERYWTPLYAFLRRRGHTADEALDLLQGFFTHLLAREVLERMELSGKLRAFLLASLKNYVADVQSHRSAAKRQPEVLVSLDAQFAEQQFLQLPSADLSPSELFERRWAIELVQRAVERLTQTEQRAGRAELFDRLLPHLRGDDDATPYGKIAQELDLTDSVVKVRMHRLRKRLGEFLRQDIELTVDVGEVDGELRHVLQLAG